MKKLVILEHGAKEFANRLWSDMSIYSYGIYLGVPVLNLTYFEHIRLTHPLHWLFARVIDRLTRSTYGLWAKVTPKYLPPSVESGDIFRSYSTFYFVGWLFRNPVGFTMYREQLLKVFGPTKHIQRKVNAKLAPFKGKKLLGVYIRQTPFRGFENGEFLVPPERVKQIVYEYLKLNQLDQTNSEVVMISDKDSKLSIKEKFFLLANCDVVIGTNSTFSNLAAWFGNAPHIVTKNETIDWDYYKGKKEFFENKYATFVQ